MPLPPVALLFATALLATGCSPETGAESNGDSSAPSVETIVDDLHHPWALAFLPDGDLLVT
ncbi:MAG: PQQ-dependent sugar dehydrogenase, partial [Guyparkeria sp.]